MDASGLAGVWRVALVAAGIAFLLVLFAEWATVAGGGERLDRRLAGFKGDAREHYRQGLLKGLEGFARWVGDGWDGKPNHFSASSYLVCLGLAVFYPVFFLTLVWAVAGGPGSIGTLKLFNDDAPTWARLMVLAAIILPAPIYHHVRRSLHWPDIFATLIAFAGAGAGAGAFAVAGALAGAGAGAVAVAVAGAVSAAFAVAGTVAGAGAVAGAVAVAFAVAVAVAVAFAFAFAGAVASAGAVTVAATVAFAFAGALAGAGSVAAMRADRARRGRKWLIALFALATLVVPLLAVFFDGCAEWIALTEPAPYAPPPAWLPDWLAASPEEWVERNAWWEGRGGALVAMPLVLFFLFLPALNALFDWLSLAVSRTLLRWTAEAPALLFADLVRAIVIIIDAFIALVLAVAIVFATAFGVAVFAKLHLLGGASGVGFVVSEKIAEIRADPGAKENWWIYAMMFWTLVPTLVHIVAYAAGLVAALISGEGRTRLAAWIEGGSGRMWPAFPRAGLLAGLRLLPGFAALALLAVNYDFTLSVIGAPFELAGRAGLHAACTDDFTFETLGTCLADGSEAIAKWVEGA